jgi:hypothetical protein
MQGKEEVKAVKAPDFPPHTYRRVNGRKTPNGICAYGVTDLPKYALTNLLFYIHTTYIEMTVSSLFFIS